MHTRASAAAPLSMPGSGSLIQLLASFTAPDHPIQHTETLCRTFVSRYAPLPSRKCPERKRPLFIVAGDGKTGTTSVTYALAMLGLRVSHWEDIFECKDGAHQLDGTM